MNKNNLAGEISGTAAIENIGTFFIMSSAERSRLVSLLTISKVPHEIPADAIVIIGGVRTPITKATRGGLKGYKADQLLAVVLKVHLSYISSSASLVTLF